MLRKMMVIGLAAAAGIFVGCVERQMTLVTEPEGARAYYNDRYVGETPATFHFTHYQAANIRFEKDGFDTLKVVGAVKPPFYERFPLDFFSEALVPATIYDRHTFTYSLEESREPDTDELLGRASELRRETLGAD